MSKRAASTRTRAREPEDEDEDDHQIKRQRWCFADAAEEFLCPITHEIPTDPVTAADGRVYERRAIEDWIAKSGSGLKSPWTQQPMDAKLLEAVQVRNAIERMVRSGAVGGPIADAWKKKLKVEKENAQWLEKTTKKAEEGDVDATYELSSAYIYGTHGLKKDDERYTFWSRCGHELGDSSCSANLGYSHERGKGAPQNDSYAVHLYTTAAERGSALGCYNLAMCFLDGICGLEQNKTEALKWLKACLNAPTDDLHEDKRETVALTARDLARDRANPELRRLLTE
jgi:hypothetical protein